MLHHHSTHQALAAERTRDLRHRADQARLVREARPGRPRRASRRPVTGRRLVAALVRFATSLSPVGRPA
ncbi:hypothetical protein ACIB24_08615 [Spongisporangium articulatum]|uniref:Uncharacterized protein n=1 Tax=Spongisporangium articulatum TaxID=3362603 RepID=A0ABW8ANE2_9ACTN